MSRSTAPLLPGEAVQLLGPSTGGIRRHVDMLARGLRERGIVAPVLGPSGVMAGIGAQDGSIEVPDGLRPAGLLRARHELVPWRHGAAVLHAHGLKAGWAAIGGRPRRPMVITVHNVVLDRSGRPQARLRRALEVQVLRRADRVIALTSSMAAELGEVVDAARIRVALPASPPPVPRRDPSEVRAALDVPAGAPLVVCAARLHPQKDLPTLLHAWRAVHVEHPDAVLAIVGEGPDRASLESLRDRLDLRSSVRMRGASPHAVDELAAADVAVMTSVWEGAALVLAEATQLGVPMVSTPVGLAGDLLDGQVGGVVVPIGEPDAVAEALGGLIADPRRARAMGDAGRRRAAELFDPHRSIDDVVAIYQEVVV